MNGTTLERPEVAAYLEAVRSRLADLPAEERDDLVADVEASLLESGEPPRLSPQDFAAELREAAGLAPEGPVAQQRSSLLETVRVWLSTERANSWLRTARELAPIWWLVRAYLVVMLGALSLGQGWPVGSGVASDPISFESSIFVLLVAGTASVWLGLRGRRRPPRYRQLAVAANVGLALALLPAAAYSYDRLGFWSPDQWNPASVAAPAPGLAVDGVPIRNVYPYSRDGTPLWDVLLFDAIGNPVNVLSGADDTSRRILADENGMQYFNSFPIRYFDPGTKTVGRPRLAPPITLPSIVTPPLEQASP